MIQNWLERFCVRHPRLAIPGLMRYIIIGNAIVFLLDLFSGGYCSAWLGFYTDAILNGQIWRIVSFVIVPESGGNLFFFALTLYFYYFIGSALEREWGSGKFTVFYVMGVLLNIVVGLFAGGASMYYVNMSLFFAFATLYPDLQFLLFFFIPVKAKWLAWLDAAFFAFAIVRFLYYGMWLYALLPVVAILNYLLFFAGDIGNMFGWAKYRASRRVVNFRAAKRHAGEKKGYLHKCAVCGRTDTEYPELEFRYCSRCSGYYCYCQDHINTHVHVQ